jgi:localization factor PodJL
MQPDLPWNVAGIPPEAREAARAAARREGLSVGDWLTRRILRNFAEGNESVENLRQSWRQAGQALRSPHVDLREDTATRDADEVLGRVSRSEIEPHSPWKRIEDQLRGVSRRLDQTERSQTENSRAMNKAAVEINVAAREQAQAFDQLGSQIAGMNERLARLEREATVDGMKDAVKALHQGLSRLATQVSQTATQSAAQIAVLAGNVEQLAAKVIESRNDLDHVSRSSERRIGSVESRLQEAERTVHTRADSLDKVFAKINASEEARKSMEAELHRHVSGLQQLNDTLDQLHSRVTMDGAAAAGTMARLEQSVANLEARSEDPERRLRGIERTLSELVTRLEDTERSNSGGGTNVEEGLRNLTMRFDAADQRHREAVAELRAAVKEATEPFARFDMPGLSTSPPYPPPQGHPQFDLPPFPDAQDHQFASMAVPAFTAPPADPDPLPPLEPEVPMDDAGLGAEPFATNSAQPSASASGESFLAAARRAARSASSEEPAAAPLGGFAWDVRGSEPASETKRPLSRYALIAGLGLLIIAAIAAGALVAHSVLSPAHPALKVQTPVAPANMSTPVPNAAAAPRPAANMVANGDVHPAAVIPATPGSPAAPQQTGPKAGPLESRESPAAPVRQLAQQPVPVSPQASFDKLKALANGGNANAEVLLGLKLLDGDGTAVNEAEAAKWLERAANQNVAVAAYRLGTLYERGHGVPANPARAAQWYTTAAKAGNYKAMHNLAVAYANGNGVTKDLVVAAQWFTRAANLGLEDSQFNLAVLYERGMGVQQSLLDAYKWYTIAAAQGDAESKARVDVLGAQLSREDKEAAQKAVQSFHPGALDANANTPPELSMVLSG